MSFRRYKGMTGAQRRSRRLPTRTRELEEQSLSDAQARLRYLLWKFRSMCCKCHREVNRAPNHPLQATCDHVVPISLGGPDKKENWQLLCRSCNLEKADSI